MMSNRYISNSDMPRKRTPAGTLIKSINARVPVRRWRLAALELCAVLFAMGLSRNFGVPDWIIWIGFLVWLFPPWKIFSLIELRNRWVKDQRQSLNERMDRDINRFINGKDDS